MPRAMMLMLTVAAVIPTIGTAAEKAATAPRLSAQEIVQRNVAARGGEVAWRAVQTLSISGKMEAGGNNQPAVTAPGAPPPPANREAGVQVQLPFTLEMKRGHKSRLELQFNGQTAVQVYDGKQGWKVRPFLNRRQVEAFTTDEARFASQEPEFDGLLVDAAARGSRIEMDGVDTVEGHAAYRLKVTSRGGRVLRDWVDAQTFLEVRTEGAPRKLDGRMHQVLVYLRDYRSVGAVKIPYQMETTVQGVRRTERLLIDKAVVNPRLEDARFAKPA